MVGSTHPFTHPGRMGKALIFVLFLVGLLASPVAPGAAFAPQEAEIATSLVVDLLPGAAGSVPSQLTVIGAAVFFRADNDDSGYELWMTLPPYIDATLVADIVPGDAGSFPENLTVHGASLFFTADDGVHGRELWVTEPPYTSARMVADVNPGLEGSQPRQLISLGTTLFFVADDGSAGFELWKTQEPFNSAQRVADIFVGGPDSSPSDLTLIGWNLFFAATNGGYRELWMSSPPYTGAVQVSAINPDGFADPKDLTPLGETLFFTAVDPEYGREVWLSEPPYTPLSTRPLNDFETRWKNSNPYDLYALGDTLFFSANIGLIGVELWKSVPPYDTTHTNRVIDLNEGFFQSSFPDQKVAIGSTLFFTASKPIDGVELWRSEAPYNEDTTFMVGDIRGGPAASAPQQLTPAGRTLFFTADDGVHGREVWQTEPPYKDATLVKDVRRGAASSDPVGLTSLGELLFFQANDGKTGAELWKVLSGYWLPETGFAPARVTPLKPQPAAKAYQDVGQMQLEFPGLGVQAPIVGAPALPEGWDLTWLGSQAGYLEGTAFPTWPGNTVLTGHAYLQDGRPGPFARLESLRYGDTVVIHAWGQRYIYAVRSLQEVSPQDLSAFRHEELDWLTLITCKGWEESTNRYRSRIVVRAVLLRIE